MGISKKEFQILWSVSEGDNTPEAIFSSVDPSLNLSMEEIKKLLRKLEFEKLVKIFVELDEDYTTEYWDVKITEKARENYIRRVAAYGEMIPEFYK